jgi:surfeit locus 1 family protein
MRVAIPLIFGLLGCAVLVSLGVWQVQRMGWKAGVIAEIEGRIDAAPVPLPSEAGPEDRFTPVTVEGTVDGAPLRVLGAWRDGGTGYRIVAPLAAGDRRIMVDLGVAPLQGEVALPEGRLAITGNLDWPDDVGPGTPAPDGDVWFGRDVAPMAAALGTEPLMVVARDVIPAVDAPTGPRPVPVGVDGIPNNHLGYAVQWFGLALVWAGMTAFYLWRIRRRTGMEAP